MVREASTTVAQTAIKHYLRRKQSDSASKPALVAASQPAAVPRHPAQRPLPLSVTAASQMRAAARVHPPVHRSRGPGCSAVRRLHTPVQWQDTYSAGMMIAVALCPTMYAMVCCAVHVGVCGNSTGAAEASYAHAGFALHHAYHNVCATSSRNTDTSTASACCMHAGCLVLMHAPTPEQLCRCWPARPSELMQLSGPWCKKHSEVSTCVSSDAGDFLSGCGAVDGQVDECIMVLHITHSRTKKGGVRHISLWRPINFMCAVKHQTTLTHTT